MLSPEHTKRIAPGIDTTKLPSFEYGKSFLSPHFGIIHKKPEMLLNFRPDYTLGIPVDVHPYIKANIALAELFIGLTR